MLSNRRLGSLAGNYDMTQSSISPSSLLLLFSPEPEFPEDLGGGGSISIRQNSTDVRNLTLSVVNNLLNTIAVNQQNEFTYQDKIHITSMLHKLGVENIQQFMQQVNMLRQEHQSISQLLDLYHNEKIENFANNKTTTELHNRSDSYNTTTQEVAVTGNRYYLHNDIYNRLKTGDIYQEIHSHQAIPSMPNTFVNNLQLQLSEQLRVSAHLQLNELRNQTVAGNRITLHHHQNSYETGELLPVPTTEREVLNQAATATLLNTIDNLFTQRFNATYATANSWTNVAEQLEQTAYNTLSRFENYHSGQSFEYNMTTQYTQSRLEMYKTEATLLQQLIREEQPSVDDKNYRVERRTDMVATYIEHPASEQEEALANSESDQKNEQQATSQRLTEQITEITRQLLNGAEPTAPPPIRTLAPMEPLRELLQEARANEQASEQSEMSGHMPSQISEILKETTSNITRPITEQIFNQLTNVLLQEPQQLSNSDFSVPPEELILQETTAPQQEMSEEQLVQQMNEVDRRNREMLIRVQERTEVLRREVVPPKPVDPAKMRADALRAINEPEKVLAEMRERPEIPIEHSHTPEIDAILELASPETRALLDAVTRYANNPEAQLEGVRRATPLELHKSVQEVLQANNTVERVERETLKTTHRIENQTVQQSLQEWTQQEQIRPRNYRPHEIEPVPIIHKSERKVFDEEILELIEQQKTSKTQIVHQSQEQVNVNTVKEVNTTTLNQQIVTQSNEEITELINRALTKQMGNISEKVYNQMERKLQMERNRRGRF